MTGTRNSATEVAKPQQHLATILNTGDATLDEHKQNPILLLCQVVPRTGISKLLKNFSLHQNRNTRALKNYDGRCT